MRVQADGDLSLSRIQAARSGSVTSPEARATHFAMPSSSVAPKAMPFRRRKSSAATKDVRLFPSMNGWFRAIPKA